MKYEYSVSFNSFRNKWQVSWTGHDPEHPHQMKGDVVVCNDFHEAINMIRAFVTTLEPELLS